LRGLCAEVPEQLVFWSVRVVSAFVSWCFYEWMRGNFSKKNTPFQPYCAQDAEFVFLVSCMYTAGKIKGRNYMAGSISPSMCFTGGST
jgi:hypothetical protein